LILGFAALSAVLCGCPSQPASSGHAGTSHPGAEVEYADEMINHGIDTLDRLEQFDADEVRDQIGGRIVEMGQTHQLPANGPSDPLLATCPEPEMLRQTVNRLNQWAQSQKPPAGWKPDPLLGNLSPELARLDVVRDLDKMQFSVYDGLSLLEAVWLRNVSEWARGREVEELQQARRLFDWLVRNIQLDAETAGRVPQFPWETLLAGRGTAMERAWVFLLLLRQQGLDAAILALRPAAEPTAVGSETRQERAWCVAVLAQHGASKALYLFEPSLGLPIPARNGIQLLEGGKAEGGSLAGGLARRSRRSGAEGEGEKVEGGSLAAGPGTRLRVPRSSVPPAHGLDIRPATLAEVIADRALLDRLDFDPQNPSWLKSADLAHIVVLVEASPVYVAARSRVVESLLAGRERLVLTTDPTAQAQRIIAAIRAAGGPGQQASARVWQSPYQTLRRRSQLRLEDAGQRLNAMLPLFAAPGTPLFKGRILHLKGRFQGQPGAIECYQAARPATQDLLAAEPKLAANHYEKEWLPAVQQASPAARSNLRAFARDLAHWETISRLQGKQDASYWLGLIAAEEGNYPAAIDYLAKRTQQAGSEGPWMPGIHYNLGRVYEALGQPEQAVEEYLSGIRSPMYPGSLLRARWLKELAAGK
jgi:tetratricopeptide (TPR) repeat protein